MPLRFAITGANGQIGSFLVNSLRNSGHIVYELVRSPGKAQNKQYSQFFDLAQPKQLPSLKNIDVLIHTAYFFDTTDKDYETINVVGTQQLFAQAQQDQVPYSIFISTLSAHAKASSLYGRIKYQLEQLLIKNAANIAVIRPGLIFHDPLQGITATMDNFVRKFPIVPLIGKGKQLIHPCFLTDLGQLIGTLSLKQPKISQPILAATEQSITFKQLVKYLAKQRKKSVLLIPIPFFGIYFLLKALELFKIKIGLRSDSLLGIQYASTDNDFSALHHLGVQFNPLNI
ncbi:MAG: hypothetical protein A3F11_02940 [Gammaproteobacteria bacterium RIFCSPHIGHO2_12_FULL_37_14]|nr:MAG: hypothetical protein A3F11_02940 [Gammaproteobacteria bacterium RIFCSPHIGHO2_12_FULL_37_14]